MHEYDVAFKLTLQQMDVAMQELAGVAIARWLGVELPKVRNARVDLLGETENRELVLTDHRDAEETQGYSLWPTFPQCPRGFGVAARGECQTLRAQRKRRAQSEALSLRLRVSMVEIWPIGVKFWPDKDSGGIPVVGEISASGSTLCW
jgi:hypothetical protein